MLLLLDELLPLVELFEVEPDVLLFDPLLFDDELDDPLFLLVVR